jgi:AbrB family looped-hinge helix DNA binding protein
MASSRTFISTKGRVTIPAEFRERFRIKPGTIVTWREEQGRLVLTPLTKKRLSKIVEFSKPQLGHRDKS